MNTEMEAMEKSGGRDRSLEKQRSQMMVAVLEKVVVVVQHTVGRGGTQ